MTTLLVIVFVSIAIAYVVVTAMIPERTKHSLFELRRRGDDDTIRRERLLEQVEAFREFVLAILVIAATGAALAAWQAWGFAALLGMVILAHPIGRLGIVGGFAGSLYARVEPSILGFVERRWEVAWFLAGKRRRPRDQALESPEQLLHLVEASGHVLDEEQRTIIRNGIHWHDTLVVDVMTKRGDVRTVKCTELLGPLVLDDLHRSGHGRFPVVRSSIDTIVGILDIASLLEVSGSKATPTAEQVMTLNPPRIEADEPLPAALALLQKSRQHMVIVVDGDGKTAGVITLADVTRSLLGKTGVK